MGRQIGYPFQFRIDLIFVAMSGGRDPDDAFVPFPIRMKGKGMPRGKQFSVFRLERRETFSLNPLRKRIKGARSH